MDVMEMVLHRLANVRRAPCGFIALCPAHDDRHPSLSIKEGERGILLKCWTGCSLDEICRALGIQTRDLFYDSGLTWKQRKAISVRPRRLDWRKMSHDLEFASESRRLRAESIFKAARQLNIAMMSGEEIDRAWRCLGVAFHALRVSENLGMVAFKLRVTGLAAETQQQRERKTAA